MYNPILIDSCFYGVKYCQFESHPTSIAYGSCEPWGYYKVWQIGAFPNKIIYNPQLISSTEIHRFDNNVNLVKTIEYDYNDHYLNFLKKLGSPLFIGQVVATLKGNYHFIKGRSIK